MKKVLFAAAALTILSLPALAQQTPNGNSAGGPARVGEPGQVGGGVPGTMPSMTERRMMMRKKMMMRKHHMRRKHMMKKKMM